MLLNCGAGEDSWESLALQGDPTSPSLRRSVLGVHWKDWCWGWNSNTLATWCEELAHLRRHWCWGRLRAGGEGDDRGWYGWMASPTQWTWIWVDYGSWWWIGRPGVLQFMGLQRVGHDWVTELNWTNTITLSDRISAHESRISVHSRGNSELLFWRQLRLVEGGIYSVHCILLGIWSSPLQSVSSLKAQWGPPADHFSNRTWL